MKKLFNCVEIDVIPVRVCNDGYYRTSENVNAWYYLTEDDFLIDNNGNKKWEVIDIGEDEIVLKITKAV